MHMKITSTQYLIELNRNEETHLSVSEYEHMFMHLVSGKIDFWHDDLSPRQLNADDTVRMFPLADFTSDLKLRAHEPSTLYLLDKTALNTLTAWYKLSSLLDFDPNGSHALLLALHAESLRCVPMQTVCELTKRMHERQVHDGEEIVRQGDAAEKFYILLTGEAEIVQLAHGDSEPKKLATLKSGDIFGEYALITGANRTATIRMTQDGSLLVGNREDFLHYIIHPHVNEAHPSVARAMIDTGHRLLDVRFEEEHEDEHIPGSILLPLHDLHKRHLELDPQHPYVVYCRSGRRSVLASLILKQHGYNVTSLQGGILDWPYEKRSLWN